MLKLIGLATISLVTLYGLEFAGIVPEGKYASFLPRPEQPSTLIPKTNVALSVTLGKPSTYQSETSRPHAETSGKFTDRVSERAPSLETKKIF